jgi:hypothetical protein
MLRSKPGADVVFYAGLLAGFLKLWTFSLKMTPSWWLKNPRCSEWPKFVLRHENNTGTSSSFYTSFGKENGPFGPLWGYGAPAFGLLYKTTKPRNFIRYCDTDMKPWHVPCKSLDPQNPSPFQLTLSFPNWWNQMLLFLLLVFWGDATLMLP